MTLSFTPSTISTGPVNAEIGDAGARLLSVSSPPIVYGCFVLSEYGKDGGVDAWWVEEVVLVSERGGPGEIAGGEALRCGRRRRGGWEPRNKVPESGAAEQVCLLGWREIEGKGGKELGQCGKCPVSYQSGCEARPKSAGG
jgi:hypothetical protein